MSEIVREVWCVSKGDTQKGCQFMDFHYDLNAPEEFTNMQRNEFMDRIDDFGKRNFCGMCRRYVGGELIDCCHKCSWNAKYEDKKLRRNQEDV